MALLRGGVECQSVPSSIHGFCSIGFRFLLVWRAHYLPQSTPHDLTQGQGAFEISEHRLSSNARPPHCVRPLLLDGVLVNSTCLLLDLFGCFVDLCNRTLVLFETCVFLFGL